MDEGIKDVVAALNEVDGWMTWDSCQGNPPDKPAVLEFCPGKLRQMSIPELERFAIELSAMISRNGCNGTRVQIQRSHELFGYVWLSLVIPVSEIEAVGNVLVHQKEWLHSMARRLPIGPVPLDAPG